MYTTSASMQDAIRVATYFSTFRSIQEIYLFGSLLKKPEGEDIDLVLVVDKTLADGFLTRISILTDTYPGAEERVEIICDILKLEKYPLIRFLGNFKLDLFLFPSDWMTNKAVWQRVPVVDRTFMATLAKAPFKFDRFAGKFLPIKK